MARGKAVKKRAHKDESSDEEDSLNEGPSKVIKRVTSFARRLAGSANKRQKTIKEERSGKRGKNGLLEPEGAVSAEASRKGPAPKRGPDSPKGSENKPTSTAGSKALVTKEKGTPRKRGRPKGSTNKPKTPSQKTQVEDTVLSTPRKRGRPKGSTNKPKTPSQKTQVEDTVLSTPRKGGRPKGSTNKPKTPSQKTQVEDTVLSTPRKRGRPKGSKNKPKTPSQKTQVEDTVLSTPRKRGRPKGSTNKPKEEYVSDFTDSGSESEPDSESELDVSFPLYNPDEDSDEEDDEARAALRTLAEAGSSSVPRSPAELGATPDGVKRKRGRPKGSKDKTPRMRKLKNPTQKIRNVRLPKQGASVRQQRWPPFLFKRYYPMVLIQCHHKNRKRVSERKSVWAGEFMPNSHILATAGGDRVVFSDMDAEEYHEVIAVYREHSTVYDQKQGKTRTVFDETEEFTCLCWAPVYTYEDQAVRRKKHKRSEKKWLEKRRKQAGKASSDGSADKASEELLPEDNEEVEAQEDEPSKEPQLERHVVVAAGHHGALKLIDYMGGSMEATFSPAHNGAVTELRSAVWAGFVTVVFSASKDQLVRVWELGTRRCLAVLKGHTGEVNTMDVDATGEFLLTAGTDYDVILWDLRQVRKKFISAVRRGGFAEAAAAFDLPEEILPFKRYPSEDSGLNDTNDDRCFVCSSGSSRAKGELVCCDSCDKSFHGKCIKPVLDLVPKFAWACPECPRPSCKECANVIPVGSDYCCCSVCRDFYHVTCLPGETLSALESAEWKCASCAEKEVLALQPRFVFDRDVDCLRFAGNRTFVYKSVERGIRSVRFEVPRRLSKAEGSATPAASPPPSTASTPMSARMQSMRTALQARSAQSPDPATPSAAAPTPAAVPAGTTPRKYVRRFVRPKLTGPVRELQGVVMSGQRLASLNNVTPKVFRLKFCMGPGNRYIAVPSTGCGEVVVLSIPNRLHKDIAMGSAEEARTLLTLSLPLDIIGAEASTIHDVAISSDGQFIAAMTSGNVIFVWRRDMNAEEKQQFAEGTYWVMTRKRGRKKKQDKEEAEKGHKEA